MDNHNKLAVLLAKYENQNCTPEEIKLLNELVGQEFALARSQGQLSLEEEYVFQKKSHTRLKQEIRPASISIFSRRNWIRIVANICLISAGSIWLFFQFSDKFVTNNDAIDIKRFVNQSDKFKTISLPDKSVIIVQKGAELVIDPEFGIKNRKVIFKGSGFFSVAKNKNLPFQIQMDKLITEVLGTSFDVATDQQKGAIEVSVVSGRVSVYVKDERNELHGVILSPNLKAIFNPDNNAIIEGIVEKPLMINRKFEEDYFNFQNISFDDFAKKLVDSYGIGIYFLNPDIGNCLFSGDLSNLSLFQQLEIACYSINAHYEIRGSKIFVEGNGCENIKLN